MAAFRLYRRIHHLGLLLLFGALCVIGGIMFLTPRIASIPKQVTHKPPQPVVMPNKFVYANTYNFNLKLYTYDITHHTNIMVLQTDPASSLMRFRLLHSNLLFSPAASDQGVNNLINLTNGKDTPLKVADSGNFISPSGASYVTITSEASQSATHITILTPSIHKKKTIDTDLFSFVPEIIGWSTDERYFYLSNPDVTNIKRFIQVDSVGGSITNLQKQLPVSLQAISIPDGRDRIFYITRHTVDTQKIGETTITTIPIPSAIANTITSIIFPDDKSSQEFLFGYRNIIQSVNFITGKVTTVYTGKVSEQITPLSLRDHYLIFASEIDAGKTLTLSGNVYDLQTQKVEEFAHQQNIKGEHAPLGEIFFIQWIYQ